MLAFALILHYCSLWRVFTCENSHRWEFHSSVTLWFHIVFTWRDEMLFRVCMKAGHFMPADVCLNKQICDCDTGHLEMDVKNYACATRSRLLGQWFHIGRAVVPPLHDFRFSFRSEMKISLRYSDRDQLGPVWLAPVWDFVLGTGVISYWNENRAGIV